MANLNTFAARMTVRAKNIGRNVNETVKDVARQVDRTVVTGTPVDTGKARSNWQVSVGAENHSEISPYKPGRYLGIGETDNAQAAMAQAEAAIAARIPGQDIYIQNNVDYIQKLNNGHSRQAPPAFVEAAVQNGVAAVKTARVVT